MKTLEMYQASTPSTNKLMRHFSLGSRWNQGHDPPDNWCWDRIFLLMDVRNRFTIFTTVFFLRTII